MPRTTYTIEVEQNGRIKKLPMDSAWFLLSGSPKIGDEIMLNKNVGSPEQKTMYERQGLKFDGKTKYKILDILPRPPGQQPIKDIKKNTVQNTEQDVKISSNKPKPSTDTFKRAD